MARPRTYAPLAVFLNRHLVGRLNRQPTGAIEFQYDRSWLDWSHTFPVSISLPLREDRYVGKPVVAVFENLLPDNEDMRRRIAARVRAKGDDAYSLLSAIGRDCVGALQFLPVGEKLASADTVNGKPIDAARVAEILAGLGSAPLGMGDDNEDFRISIAGAQEKTALLFWKKKWNIPHGSTPTTHILKPQIGVLRNGIDLSNSVENEHFCMLLTRALGLPAAKTSIVDFDGTRALVVERFDRQLTRDKRLLRVPQEDCCQALSVPPVNKYEQHGGPGIGNILQLLKASDAPSEDQRIFMKAQIVFWIIGATDGHAKNFSISLHPGGGFRLTPLYDVMSAQPAADAGQIRRNKMKFAMAVGNRRHYVMATITPRHFLESAQRAGMPMRDVENIFGELREVAPSAIAKVRESVKEAIPTVLSNSIIRGAKQRLRVLDL